nr:ribosomal protein S1 [Pulsatilla chinensis var. kissii]
MSIYLSRSFPRSNSSFFLCSGNASQSAVLRLREEIFLVDAGLGTPRICMQDEPTGVPINRATRFENKVGSLDVVAGESLIKKRILERLFINLVAGESLIKERAAARFNSLVGSTDVVAGEPLLLLPRRFRQNRAWMELNKIWRTNTKVKGFFLKKVKGGYSVAIAGFLTFLPFRRLRIANDRFIIESIKPKRKRKKTMNIVVWSSNSGRSNKKLEPRSLKRNPYRPRRGGFKNGGPQKFRRPS